MTNHWKKFVSFIDMLVSKLIFTHQNSMTIANSVLGFSKCEKVDWQTHKAAGTTSLRLTGSLVSQKKGEPNKSNSWRHRMIRLCDYVTIYNIFFRFIRWFAPRLAIYWCDWFWFWSKRFQHISCIFAYFWLHPTCFSWISEASSQLFDWLGLLFELKGKEFDLYAHVHQILRQIQQEYQVGPVKTLVNQAFAISS